MFPDCLWGILSFLYSCVLGAVSPRVKRQRYEAHLSSSSDAEVKNGRAAPLLSTNLHSTTL
jgi:hypothetical protein